MTWAEYQIRLFSLKRNIDQEKEKIKILGDVIIASSFLEGKSKTQLTKSLDMVLFGNTKPKVSEYQLEMMRKVREQYLKRNKDGR